MKSLRYWVVVLLVTMFFGLAAVLAQEAKSVNAVGYVKINVPSNKYVLVSSPFVDFSASIDAIFDGQLTGTDQEGTADRVLVYDPIALHYDIYWKVDPALGPPEGGHMLDEFGSLATNVFLTPGQGFWIHSRATSNQTVILKGEVPNESRATNSLYAGFTLVGFPFATDQSLGDNTNLLVSGAFGTDQEGTADRILFFDTASGGYKIFWFVDPALGPPEGGKWLDEFGAIATQKFELGVGAWYHRRSNDFSWVENRPYSPVNQ